MYCGGVKMPNVSVIVPCFNSSLTIGRCLESIVCQTLQPDEIILVIDKSNDMQKTLDVIDAYKISYTNIKIKVKIPDIKSGVAGARNIGWEMSTSKYLAFLDSDDAWVQKKLYKQVNFMLLNPNVDMVCGLTKIYSPQTQEENGNWSLTAVNKYRMLFKNEVCTRTVLLKRILPLRFEVGKQHSEDYLLWLQLLFSGIKVIKFEEIMAYSFKSDYTDAGLASNLENAEIGEIDTIFKIFKQGGLNYILLPLVFAFSIIKYIRRRILKSWLHARLE
jgi:glycosyltransferase involved in cell wall biosynthesis